MITAKGKVNAIILMKYLDLVFYIYTGTFDIDIIYTLLTILKRLIQFVL